MKELRWEETDPSWIPKSVIARWYTPHVWPSKDLYDIILWCDDQLYWLIRSDDMYCETERLGPYDTFERAKLAVEMLLVTSRH